MSFVSSPPLPASGSPDTVANDGWFPNISIAQLRDAMRIGGTTISDARVRDAAIGGMLSANRELALWRTANQATGQASLADVASVQIAGMSRLVLLYRRAVYSYAAADLAETHRDISATADGSERAEAKALSADEHRRNATYAIRDILGRTRTTVEMI